MDRNEIVEFLIDCVAQTYRADASELSESTNLPEQFGIKSMQQLALCGLIENGIDIVLSIGDLGKYPTIGELADYIAQSVM